MNQAEIIAMATEAGLNSYRIAPGEAVAVWERFAALVAAKERDACAQECVAISVDYWMGDAQFEAATRCCNAIRARGQKEGA